MKLFIDLQEEGIYRLDLKTVYSVTSTCHSLDQGMVDLIPEYQKQM